MLQIVNGAQIATDEYYIQHKETGFDELCFEIPLTDPAYYALSEESRILETTEQQTYTVKTISGSRATAKIGCVLDLSDWQAALTIGYNSQNRTPVVILNGVKPAGWTVTDNAGSAKTRQIKMDAPTPLEVVQELEDTFGCAVRFNTHEHTATVFYPDDIQLSNSYAVDTVNLRRAPEFKGRSSDLCTRIYPIGKDGLGIASVNSGKAYVENLTYTQKVICAVWKDQRYTDAASLRDDAQKRVDELSQPERSWKLSIADLYRINPTKWADMAVGIFTVLRLVDNAKGFHANIQVREDKVYPYYPEKNEITVSTVTRSVQRTLKRIRRAISNPNSSFYQQMNA